MNHQHVMPHYQQVSDALDLLQAHGTAGQSHGLLCALISAHARINREAWVDSLLGGHIEANDEPARAAYHLLHELFNATKDAFQQEAFSLPLLLPDDDAPLVTRVDALGEWCQGYLTGLHLLGLDIKNNKNEAIQECLQDLLSISQVDLTPEDEADQASESHFVELEEHVRVAVLTIMQELQISFKEHEHGEGCDHLH
jgi:yecA family protein